MFIICVIIFVVIAMSLTSSGGGRPPVIMCNSVSCSHNRLCRCTRKEIAIYDNTVKGLCLDHTESMKERILDPMQEKRMIKSSGDSEFGKKMIDKIMKAQEEKLLKDPDTFDKWMNKVYRKRQGKQRTKRQ